MMNPVDTELRSLRHKCHVLFDEKWKSARPSRQKKMRTISYGWLATKMQVARRNAHISMFDKEQCRKLLEILEGEREQVR